MKKLKIILIAFLVALLGISSISLVHADDDIRPVGVKITTPKKTVFAGTVFELKARMTPAKADDDFLYWSVVGTKGIVQLEKDRDDDDIKIKALRAGTTKIRCQIKGTKKYSVATVTVKKPTYAFSRVGKATRTIEAGDDFELKVKRSGGLKDNDLKWSIKNRNIVQFDDDDITDDEIELEARRPGTTTVTCYNKKTKKSITFTIRVIRDRDDDNDDDDDDDNDDDDNDDDDDDDDDDD